MQCRCLDDLVIAIGRPIGRQSNRLRVSPVVSVRSLFSPVWFWVRVLNDWAGRSLQCRSGCGLVGVVGLGIGWGYWVPARLTLSPVQFRPDMLVSAIGVGLDWPPGPPRAIGGWRGSHPDTKNGKTEKAKTLL